MGLHGLADRAVEVEPFSVHELGPFTADSGDKEWTRVFLGQDDSLAGEDEWFVLRSVSGLGKEMAEGHLLAKNPVASDLRREHRPLLQYDIDLQPRFQIMEPAERE